MIIDNLNNRSVGAEIGQIAEKSGKAYSGKWQMILNYTVMA
jgi:hypothetical protein